MRKSHITLRIDSANLQKLKEEAQKRNLSVNVLINQALELYSSWYSYAPYAGVISIWKDFPRLLLEKHTYAEIEEIAKELALTKAKDTSLILNTKFDYDSFIEVIKNWLKVSGFPYKYEKSDNADKLVMQFDMGKKWSHYVAKCYEAIFDSLGAIKVKSEATENTVIMSITRS